MLIDLTDIIKDYGGKLELSEEFDMPKQHFLGEDFVFEGKCVLKGHIFNNTKMLELKADVTGKATVHCSRCGKPMSIDVNFPISEVLARDDVSYPEEDEVVSYSGNEIELDEIITNSFLMNVSGKYLCSEDCRGLCPKCGKNLNDGDCGCDRDVMDPRWEKLAEIMKNMSDTE